jgi:hypothetical protein
MFSPTVSLPVYLPRQCWLYTTSLRRSCRVIIICSVGAYNRHPITTYTMQRDEVILTSWPVNPNRTPNPVTILRFTVWLKQDPNPLIQLPICAQFSVILTPLSVPLVGFHQGLAFLLSPGNVQNLKKKKGFVLRFLSYVYEFKQFLATCYEVSSFPTSCYGDLGFKSRFKDWLFWFIQIPR